jgi:hypothetical protein
MAPPPIERIVEQPKKVEDTTCGFITKAGNPCKRKGFEKYGGLCPTHKKLNDVRDT